MSLTVHSALPVVFHVFLAVAITVMVCGRHGCGRHGIGPKSDIYFVINHFCHHVNKQTNKLSNKRGRSQYLLQQVNIVTSTLVQLKVEGAYSSSWDKSHNRPMGRHLPCGIIQCYLPPDKWTCPALTPGSKLVLDLPTPERRKAELT